MAVYFTSDLHFGHKNLCLGLRDMSSEESDKLIIDNWNKVVSKRDIVYILGDITMENPKLIKKYIDKLNGIKRVIGGNHDDRKCCDKYKELGITVMGSLQYKGYICTHIPVHPACLGNFKGNIHGHIHLSGNIDDCLYEPESIDPKYYNVNTEFHEYTPVSFDTILQYFDSHDSTKVSNSDQSLPKIPEFKYSCFIRSNNNQLRRELRLRGYTFSDVGSYSNKNLATTRTTKHYSFIPDGCIESSNPNNSWSNCRIDCGNNATLFLAVASLNDYTDAYQWFTDGTLWEMSSNDLPSKYMQLNGHKASLDELKEHFKE